MKTFAKKYQLWKSADGGYTFEEFDTLAECIAAPKYSDWYITKGVTIAVTEASDDVAPAPSNTPRVQITTGKDLLGKTDELITDEDKDFERKMRGPIAPLG